MNTLPRQTFTGRWTPEESHNMSIEHIQDILPEVEMPSRYLGNEINVIRKDLDRVDLRIALAFPGLCARPGYGGASARTRSAPHQP